MKIYPCEQCAKKFECAALAAMSHARAPWDLDALIYDFSSSICVARADRVDGHLEVRIECNSFVQRRKK